MTENPAPSLDARLRQLAVDFILPGGLRVDGAVRLAENMVAAGVHGEATVKVASLSRDSLASDADPVVRAMLREHGFDVPVVVDDDSKYQVLLRAFGFGDLPLHFFEGPFFVRVPAWDDQGPLDRALVILLDKRDHVTTGVERAEIEQEMRSIVRDHIAAE